jgi:peptidoglycan-N-acetylglucosamine deacetylase
VRHVRVLPLPLLAAVLALTACATPSAPTTGRWTTAGPGPSPTPAAAIPTPTPRASASSATLAAPSPTASREPKVKAKPAADARSGPSGTVSMTGSEAVALTFDDGPDPVTTPKLLDVLKAQGVKATFCLVGHRARDNQAVVARIAREGHTLCNHSWQHLDDLGHRPEKELLWDLRRTNREILRAAPGATVSYFRAPYGNFSPRLNRYARQLGMTPIFWDVDDESYQTSTYGRGPAMVDHIVTHVKRSVRPGSIVLGHDMAKPFTVTAYARLLPWLKSRYTLIALPAAT